MVCCCLQHSVGAFGIYPLPARLTPAASRGCGCNICDATSEVRGGQDHGNVLVVRDRIYCVVYSSFALCDFLPSSVLYTHSCVHSFLYYCIFLPHCRICCYALLCCINLLIAEITARSFGVPERCYHGTINGVLCTKLCPWESIASRWKQRVPVQHQRPDGEPSTDQRKVAASEVQITPRPVRPDEPRAICSQRHRPSGCLAPSVLALLPLPLAWPRLEVRRLGNDVLAVGDHGATHLVPVSINCGTLVFRTLLW